MDFQPQTAQAMYPSLHPRGFRLPDVGEIRNMFASATALTAGLDAGGQAGALLLTFGNSEVDTANAGDGVMAPYPALPGLSFQIYDASGQAIQVYGQGLDTIIPVGSNTPAAAATGVSQANFNVDKYVCFTKGVWKQTILA